MKKILLFPAAIVVLAGLAAAVAASLLLDRAVVAGANSFGPRLTGTTFVLQNASISPLTGRGTLEGLTIGNPDGWRSEKAISLDHISVAIKPFSLLRDRIVIDRIVIEGPELVYETRLIASNIGDLQKNIERATGTGRPAAAGDPPDKTVEIRHLLIRGGTVTVGMGTSAVKVPLPPIELHNIGAKEEGISLGQASAEVLNRVLASVSQAAAGAATRGGGPAGDTLQRAGDQIRGLLRGNR